MATVTPVWPVRATNVEEVTALASFLIERLSHPSGQVG